VRPVNSKISLMNASTPPAVSSSSGSVHDQSSPDHRAAVAAFKTFFSTLNKSNLHRLNEVFAEDIVFIDPFHEVRGLDNVATYYEGMYENLESIGFEYKDDVIAGDEAVITWVMTYRHPRLNGGSAISVDGVTKLRFRGDLVVHHRDYFDAGQLLYEHVPVLGWAINKIKQRL